MVALDKSLATRPIPTFVPRQKQSKGDTLLAGYIAGVISRTATAPLDRTSQVLRVGDTAHTAGQGSGMVSVMRSLVREGGVRSLWNGNLINCVQCGPESAVMFYVYHLYADHVAPDGNLSTAQKFVGGAVAGSVSMTAVYPLYVAQARRAVAAPGCYTGTFDVFHKTVTQEGWLALTRGYGASFARIIPYKGIDLGVYNVLKDRTVALGEPLSTWRAMVYGAFAAAISQTLTFPLATVRTRLMSQGESMGRPEVYKGLHHCFTSIVREEGVAALYRGGGTYVAKMMPATALQFAVYNAVMTSILAHRARQADGDLAS